MAKHPRAKKKRKRVARPRTTGRRVHPLSRYEEISVPLTEHGFLNVSGICQGLPKAIEGVRRLAADAGRSRDAWQSIAEQLMYLLRACTKASRPIRSVEPKLNSIGDGLGASEIIEAVGAKNGHRASLEIAHCFLHAIWRAVDPAAAQAWATAGDLFDPYLIARDWAKARKAIRTFRLPEKDCAALMERIGIEAERMVDWYREGGSLGPLATPVDPAGESPQPAQTDRVKQSADATGTPGSQTHEHDGSEGKPPEKTPPADETEPEFQIDRDNKVIISGPNRLAFATKPKAWELFIRLYDASDTGRRADDLLREIYPDKHQSLARANIDKLKARLNADLVGIGREAHADRDGNWKLRPI